MILINSSPKDALKLFQPFLPIFVPVGIGCLLAKAENEGIKALFVDEQVEDNVLGVVAGYVKEIEPPYIFGFSVLTAAFKSAIQLSSELKKCYPDSVVVFGGIHPTALPEECLALAHVDMVIRGEGEKPLIELYRCLKEKRDFTHIPNLSYREKGKMIHNPQSPIIEELDLYPQFPYHLFDQNKYDLGFVLSSRGCPYKCIFCSNRITTGRTYRFRSSKTIADELEMLHDIYKKKSVLFLDDNLLVSKRRIYDLLEEIRNRGLNQKMTFNFQARGDNVDFSLLRDLYNGGFKSVFFGLETASEKLMKVVKKGETVAQCIEAVKIAKAIGFHVSATFIYSLPGETHRDRMNCIELSKELDLDMVRYNNATPYPGTELYDIARSENRLNVIGQYENFNSVSTFIENPFKKIPLSYVPEGNTANEIRMDILLSYLLFYFDFKRLKSIFVNPEKGVGWFNAGEELFAFCKKTPALLVMSLLMILKFSELFVYVLRGKGNAPSIREVCAMFRKRSKFKEIAKNNSSCS